MRITLLCVNAFSKYRTIAAFAPGSVPKLRFRVLKSLVVNWEAKAKEHKDAGKPPPPPATAPAPKSLSK